MYDAIRVSLLFGSSIGQFIQKSVIVLWRGYVGIWDERMRASSEEGGTKRVKERWRESQDGK